jgi:hypothetical protein
MEACEDPKPMKRFRFKHFSRLLTELVVLLAIYLLGTQLAVWLAWPVPGGVVGLGLLLATFATGLVLETPVALENIRGTPSALWVHEVSFKGVLVEIRGRLRPPKTFSLWFSPSGYERIALRGTFERETARGLFAYRLSQGDVDETERLRQFILHQHRLVHPQMHA